MAQSVVKKTNLLPYPYTNVNDLKVELFYHKNERPDKYTVQIHIQAQEIKMELSCRYICRYLDSA